MTEPEARDESEAEETSPVLEEAQVVARGRAARTPFVALGGVAVVVWTVAGLLAAALLVLMWLL
jgi:hypothetical protein